MDMNYVYKTETLDDTNVFREDVIEQLRSGVLVYKFVSNFRRNYLAMLEEDLENYNQNKDPLIVQEKVLLHEEIISAMKERLHFKYEFGEFLRKMSEIIKKDVEHSDLMRNFYEEVRDVFESHNL